MSDNNDHQPDPSQQPSPAFEPLVDIDDVSADAEPAAQIDLVALVPKDTQRRRGLFARALKYMNFLAEEGRR